MTTGEWSTVVVVVEPDEVDVVSGLLWDAGVAGIEESLQPDGRVELRAGCEADAVDEVRRVLTDRWAVAVATVAADAGLDDWREHATAWRAGERFVVVPAWQSPPDWVTGADIALVIDPAHSFGSGSHPTTRLCLAAMERLVRPGTSVADIGCGSGVLAVAAARRGARPVRGVDVDAGAVDATAANAARNGVGSVVVASIDPVSALDAGAFDVVVANIGAGVLRSLAADIAALVASDGALVLSGVLDEQVDEVVAAFTAHGLALVRTDVEDGWCALELRRIGANG